MNIRPYRPGEELALHAVFHSSVHGLACQDYTREQLEAWAPVPVDAEVWRKRIQRIQPFVVEINGEVVAYADVQGTGYIDHFFVAAAHARRGVGSCLMRHVQAQACARGIAVLSSDVSRTAQPFFQRFGFCVTEHRQALIRGVAVPNARMSKVLTSRFA